MPDAPPPSSPVRPGLARSILSNWGAFLFSALVNFMLSPYIVRTLGDTVYGAWVLLVTLVGYLGLLDLGVRGAVTRYVARFHAARDHAEAGRVASSALALFTVAGMVAIALSGVMALLVGHVFRVPPQFEHVARVVALLGGVNIAVSLISGVFGGVLTGLQRFDYNNAVEIGVAALRAVAILVALDAGHGLLVLALVQLTTTILRGAASWWLARRLYPELKIDLRGSDRYHVRLIFSFGLAVSLLQAMGALMLYSDSLVIGALLPVGMITYFSIGGSLHEYARAIVSGISQTLTPWMSATETQGDPAALQRVLVTGGRLSTLAILPVAVTFLIRGQSFIGLWMGPQYAALSGNVLRVLSLTLWCIAGYQIVGASMIGVSRHVGLIPIFVTEALCNLGLSILWVRAYGVIGCAWGTAVPRLVASLVVGPWYARRNLGVPLRTFWVSVFVQPTVAMLPFALGSYAIERLWPAQHLLLYFGQVALTLPLAVAGVWAFAFTPAERHAWAGRLKAWSRRSV
jgi:O-antigen/teichoic acid export membrane protein